MKLAQILARHGDQKLTLNLYGNVNASNQSDATNKLDGPLALNGTLASDGLSTSEPVSEAVANRLNRLLQLGSPHMNLNPCAHVYTAEPSGAINKPNGPPPMERLSTTEHRSTAADVVAQGVAKERDEASRRCRHLTSGGQ